MDNEKKPEFLEKILEEGGGDKAVNENPALDKKKVLEPLKDESTTLPDETRKTDRIEKVRTQGGPYGRGRGGDAKTEPNLKEGNKSPAQKILEKGKRSSWSSGRSGSGGALGTNEPEEMLKDKQDAINPEEPLSQKKEEKPVEVAMNITDKAQPGQKKQESQPQQSRHRSAFKASIDAKVRKLVKQKSKGEKEKPAPEKAPPKREGIKAEIARKLEEVKKTTAQKSTVKAPKPKIAKPAPKPVIIKGK